MHRKRDFSFYALGDFLFRETVPRSNWLDSLKLSQLSSAVKVPTLEPSQEGDIASCQEKIRNERTSKEAHHNRLEVEKNSTLFTLFIFILRVLLYFLFQFFVHCAPSGISLLFSITVWCFGLSRVLGADRSPSLPSNNIDSFVVQPKLGEISFARKSRGIMRQDQKTTAKIEPYVQVDIVPHLIVVAS